MKNNGYFHLKLNNTCNCNCNFCADPLFVRKEKNPDLVEIKSLLDSGIKSGFSNLIITGGEPTISPLFLDTLDYARSIGYDFIHIVTNARMLSSETYLQKLIDAGVDRFQISYFAHEPFLFDRISGSKGSFRQVCAGLMRLKERSCTIMFNTVITKDNMKYLPEMYVQMQFFNPIGIQFAYLHPVGNALLNKDEVVPKYSEMMPYLEKVFRMSEYFGYDKLFVENIPFCVLGENNLKFAADNNYPDSERKLHQNWKRKDLDRCQSCKHKESCSGVWNTYLSLYGENL